MGARGHGERIRGSVAALIFVFPLVGHGGFAQTETPAAADPTDATSEALSLDACQKRLGGYERILENERSLRLAAQEQALAAEKQADAPVSTQCPQPGGEPPAPQEVSGIDAHAEAAERLARTLDDLESALKAISTVSPP